MLCQNATAFGQINRLQMLIKIEYYEAIETY